MPPCRAIVFRDPHVAIGVACRLMLHKPAFAALPFGAWMAAVVGQAERGHARFFIDRDEVVRGFFGYALCAAADAEAWAFREATLADERCRAGDCMVINAWVGGEGADGPLRAAMVAEARRISGACEALYYKRFYPDGRIRPIRLPRTRFHRPA